MMQMAVRPIPYDALIRSIELCAREVAPAGRDEGGIFDSVR
jgi:hypothetical protein